MSEQLVTNVFVLTSKPGIKRDGTPLDNEYYTDGQWVRFQRGRPKKMGGFRSMSDFLTGPIRNVYVDARSVANTAHTFSPWGIQQLTFDFNGAGAGVIDRTPAGLAYNANYNWQSDAMFNSGGGGLPVLIAASAPDLDNIANESNGGVYSGGIADATAFTALDDGTNPISVSGGCCVLQPFLFVYGNNGLIKNSNANNITGASGWSGTNANTANVAGCKIVKGLPVRGGGQSPAGLFWGLDVLIRVSYVGGTALWAYDPLGSISIASKSGVIEYDNIYYWPGLDRFYAYTGVIQELPCALSQNFFFDNLNYTQAQKIWCIKVPRFGEIWWFFPTGTATECDHVLIFNVRENTWYDSALARTAGRPADVFRYPVMAGGEPTATVLLTYTAVTGTFNTNEVVTGGTSGATGRIVRILGGQLNLTDASGTFANGETITGASGATGTVTAVPQSQELDTLWQHEVGYDRVKGASFTAIPSYFETSNFQLATGGPTQDVPQGATNQVRLTKVEPDFLSAGTLQLTVRGQAYAQAPVQDGGVIPFDDTTTYLATREQRRQMSLRVESNEVGGFYEGGRTLLHVEPGDERA